MINVMGSPKNRVALWLRSERAFGLGSVPTPPPGTTATQNQPLAPTTPVVSVAIPAVARIPVERGTPPRLTTEQKIAQLAALDQQEVSVCRHCRLCQTRSMTVFGEGDVDAPVMFIGEGPGANEDRTGRPFVGRAGQLLDKMIAGMGFTRQQMYIANIIKCRACIVGPPAQDRAPDPEEVEACAGYLERQVDIIRPKVIVTLGLPAAKFVLQSNSTMGRLRGIWGQWRGINVMPTFHPAYILRVYSHDTPERVKQVREQVWSDLKKVLAELGLSAPQRPAEEKKM
jgi:DNA polymerase